MTKTSNNEFKFPCLMVHRVRVGAGNGHQRGQLLSCLAGFQFPPSFPPLAPLHSPCPYPGRLPWESPPGCLSIPCPPSRQPYLWMDSAEHSIPLISRHHQGEKRSNPRDAEKRLRNRDSDEVEEERVRRVQDWSLANPNVGGRGGFFSPAPCPYLWEVGQHPCF